MNLGQVVDSGVEFEIVWNGNVRDGWDAPTPEPLPDCSHLISRTNHGGVRKDAIALMVESRIMDALTRQYCSYYDLQAITSAARTTIVGIVKKLVARGRLQQFSQYQRRTGRVMVVYGRPDYPFPLQPQGKRPCVKCQAWKAPSDFTHRGNKCRLCMRVYWREEQERARLKQRDLFAGAA